MLNELLAEIKKGGPLEINQLARKLNTTSELVSVMLDDLKRMGLIFSYKACSTGCAGCSLASSCGHKSTNNTKLFQFHLKESER